MLLHSILRTRDRWVLMVMLAYVLWRSKLIGRAHQPSYTYVDLTEDQWLVVTPEEEPPKDKPNCPIIPKFDAEDWREFRQQARYESYFPEDDHEDEDMRVMKFRQQLAEKGFEHQSSWTPSSCNPVHNVTVIVPYRNRLDQLKKFVVHMHPFLQLQQVSYRIMIVEQMDNRKFNRAKLINVGFSESQIRFPSHCYVFHDVDQLPQNLENIYGCTKSPRLMSAAINSWRYLLHYDEFLGGVVSMTGSQFKEINGYINISNSNPHRALIIPFSNSYFGWGAEDDDFYDRVIAHSMNVTRFSPVISSYLMTPHIKEESGNNEKLYVSAKDRFTFDGLSDLNYTLVSFEDGIGFTYIQVYV